MEKSMPGTPEYRFVRTDKLYMVARHTRSKLSPVEVQKLLDMYEVLQVPWKGSEELLRSSKLDPAVFVYELEAVSLLDHLLQYRQLDEAQARFVFKQLLASLHKMHVSNVLAVNLKPENVLLLPNSKVKIVKEVAGEGKRNTVYFADAYSPPEGFMLNLDESSLTPAWDVFALGNALGIMVSGKKLFLRATDQDPLFQLLTSNSSRYFAEHLKKSRGDAELSPELKDLLAKMLHRSPAARPLAQVRAHPWLAGPTSPQLTFLPASAGEKALTLGLSREQSEEQRLKSSLGRAVLGLESVESREAPEFRQAKGLVKMNHSYFSAPVKWICTSLPRISEKLGGTLVEGKDPYSFIYEMGRQNHFKMLMKLYKTENCSVAQFHILDGSMFAFRDTVDQMKQELIEMYMDK